MDSFLKDILQGFMILSVVCAIHGCTSDMMNLAGRSQRMGLMSYSKYTRMLTK